MIGNRYNPVFLRVRPIRTCSFLFSFSSSCSDSIRQRFFCDGGISCLSSRIDRRELPGVAVLRPRLRLAAPGCLLGGAMGGLSAAAPGRRQPLR